MSDRFAHVQYDEDGNIVNPERNLCWMNSPRPDERRSPCNKRSLKDWPEGTGLCQKHEELLRRWSRRMDAR